MDLCIATHNLHKLQEIQELLPASITLKSLDDIGWLEEIPETASTIEGNACQKADFIGKRFNLNCFADDTGLEVKALNGAPGVYSARFAGQAKNSLANCQKLLQELGKSHQRQAQFRTVICLWLDGQQHQFEGIVRGEIVTDPRGTNGFGYDPLFRPRGSSLTFAEMTEDQKNQCSHRRVALDKMVRYLMETGLIPIDG